MAHARTTPLATLRPPRRLGHQIATVAADLPLFLTAPLYRRWHLRWGTTDQEVQGPMPGDELVPKASFEAMVLFSAMATEAIARSGNSKAIPAPLRIAPASE